MIPVGIDEEEAITAVVESGEVLPTAGGTLTGQLGLSQPDVLEGGYFARVYPRDPEGGKEANLPFNFVCNQTDNPPNLTNNFIVGFGHNLSQGGGRESTDEAAIGMLFEQRFDSGDLDIGGLPYMEMHIVYVASTTANNVAASQQLRLRSYTINKGLNTVDLYDTSNKYYVKLPAAYYYQTEYGDETDAIWWSMQPGEFILKNGIHGTQQISLSCNLTYDSGNAIGRATFSAPIIRMAPAATFEVVAPNTTLYGQVAVQAGDLTLNTDSRLISNNSTNLAIYLAAGSAFAEGAWRSRTGLEVYIPNTPPGSGTESYYIYAKSVGGAAFPVLTAGGNVYDFALKVAAPASASATGIAGTWAYDSNYFYLCVATDTWRRVAHATW